MARKRRGYGEGSIYQRKDGKWCASMDVGFDTTGRRKRRYVYGKTKKEVQEKKCSPHKWYKPAPLSSKMEFETTEGLAF